MPKEWSLPTGGRLQPTYELCSKARMPVYRMCHPKNEHNWNKRNEQARFSKLHWLCCPLEKRLGNYGPGNAIAIEQPPTSIPDRWAVWTRAYCCWTILQSHTILLFIFIQLVVLGWAVTGLFLSHDDPPTGRWPVGISNPSIS